MKHVEMYAASMNHGILHNLNVKEINCCISHINQHRYKNEFIDISLSNYTTQMVDG